MRGFQTAQFLLEHRDGDGRIAGGADCAVFDGVGELFDGSRVVPQTGGGGLRHFVERAFVLVMRREWRRKACILREMQTCAEKP